MNDIRMKVADKISEVEALILVPSIMLSIWKNSQNVLRSDVSHKVSKYPITTTGELSLLSLRQNGIINEMYAVITNIKYGIENV